MEMTPLLTPSLMNMPTSMYQGRRIEGFIIDWDLLRGVHYDSQVHNVDLPSRSSQSSDRGPTPQHAVAQTIDPDLIRRLDVIERLQPLSTIVDPTHLHTVVRQIMRRGEHTSVRAKVTDRTESNLLVRFVRFGLILISGNQTQYKKIWFKTEPNKNKPKI